MKHMKILITGGSGLLGGKVAELAQARGDEVFSGYAHNAPGFGKAVKFDLLDGSGISETIMRIKPEVIIHSAALTDVDRCERERELAYKINVEGTRIISEVSKQIGSFLIYISTDYVFDGSRGMYREDDSPNPLSYYGPVSYTHLRAHETVLDLVCRLLLEKKNHNTLTNTQHNKY